MEHGDFGPDILTLIDEEGAEHEFEVLDRLEEGDQQYLALVPTVDPEDALDEADELVVLKVVEDGGEEYLEPIDDEDEFSRIADIFMARLEEDYEFIDEDAN
jgi:uncharacterized protein YrzB (UPF0473 family)